MFLARSNLRVTLRGQPRTVAWSQPRRNAAGVLKACQLEATTPLAEQLAATNLWQRTRDGSAKRGRLKGQKADKAKINVVDEKLCDDIIDYVRPSLDRHVGCDLIDLFPGAGLWSRKLHDVLQPRSHIMMDPDADFYRPFLEPLLGRPNTTLLSKNGIIWKDLSEVLSPDFLPHQAERPRQETPQRNDTLLVTANLAYFPKKKFRTFESVADLLLYQFISAVRSGSLFQKYGLVRMLLWVGDDEKLGVLPRAIQRRRRLAIEAEVSTEWVRELAGCDMTERSRFVRDHAIDLESARNVLGRMEANGVRVPAGRESKILTEARERRDDLGTAGKQAVVFERVYLARLRAMEDAFAREEFKEGSEQFLRLRQLRNHLSWNTRRGDRIQDLMLERDAIADLHPADEAGREARQQREAAWNDKVLELNRDLRLQFLLAWDNLHLVRQSPPVLNWDRREQEPLAVRDTDFFPNVPCALLDIQPKAMHPLLRATGPGTSHSGDFFELILRTLLQSPKDPVSKTLANVWPGAADGVLPHCPSLRDPALGGSTLGGFGEVSSRVLSERQLTEILDAWMKWPFAPTYPEFIGRVVDDLTDKPAEEDGGMLE